MFLFITATRIRVNARWRGFIRASWISFTGRSELFFASCGGRVFHIPGNEIETHDPRPNQKHCEPFRSDQVTNATEPLFGLRPPGVVAKTLLRNNGGGHFKLKTQIPN